MPAAEADKQRKRGQTFGGQYTFDQSPTEHNLKTNASNGEHLEHGERLRLSTNRSDPMCDPVIIHADLSHMRSWNGAICHSRLKRLVWHLAF